MLVTALALLLNRKRAEALRAVNPYVTTVALSGTPGARIVGEYIQAGRHVPISAVLPWSLSQSNLTRLEVRKVNLQDTLTLEARGGGSMVSGRADPGLTGIRVEMDGGWSFHSIR